MKTTEEILEKLREDRVNSEITLDYYRRKVAIKKQQPHEKIDYHTAIFSVSDHIEYLKDLINFIEGGSNEDK